MRKGEKMSEEQRKKTSEAKKKNPTRFWLGKKRSPETVEKIRKGLVGRASRNKGKKMSDEHKKVLSLAHVGQTAWNKGKTKKTDSRVAQPWLGKKRPEAKNFLKSFPKGNVPWNKNKKHPKISGESNVNWKGGITPLVAQIRHCFKNRQWRSDVFTRDNFTCTACGARGCYVEADHFPKMFSVIFSENKITSLEQALACEEFWNINNGRTLCVTCHNKTKNKKT